MFQLAKTDVLRLREILADQYTESLRCALEVLIEQDRRYRRTAPADNKSIKRARHRPPDRLRRGLLAETGWTLKLAGVRPTKSRSGKLAQVYTQIMLPAVGESKIPEDLFHLLRVVVDTMRSIQR